MSSSGDSDHDFNDWSSAAPQGEGPHQIRKKSRIIAAVEQNDVETLKSLLTSPKWYKVRDITGYDILQIAILKRRGADVNAQNDSGETPLVKMLHQLCLNSAILLEGVSLLIYYGADVSKRNVHGHNAFEVALRIFPSENIVTIQENLLYLTIDEYSHYTLPFDIVLSIINAKSPLYCKIIDSIANIKFFPDEVHLDVNWYGEFLVAIDTEYLQVLMEKFGHVLKGPRRRLSHAVLVKNFQFLIETDLFFETLDVLSDVPLCS
ncbi:Ank 2 domain containing protein, partial [Asbolus verrucosus]